VARFESAALTGFAANRDRRCEPLFVTKFIYRARAVEWNPDSSILNTAQRFITSRFLAAERLAATHPI
jgi:hypothetical protein